MARLKPIPDGMLRGSTLVETIVASVLFLILFFLAMEMLVRIGARRPGEGLLQMEVDHRVCVQEFRSGDFAPGEYTRPYAWGEITVTVEPYRDLAGIEEVRFTTRLETGGWTFIHRILKPAGP